MNNINIINTKNIDKHYNANQNDCLKYPVLNPDNSSEGMILVKMYVPVRS